jgi:hypothetical protein
MALDLRAVAIVCRQKDCIVALKGDSVIERVKQMLIGLDRSNGVFGGISAISWPGLRMGSIWI